MSNPGTGDDAVSEPVDAPAGAGDPVGAPVDDATVDPASDPTGDPEVPVHDAPAPPGTGPDRRLLLALAGGAAVLVLLAAIVFVVSRRGGTNGDVATAPGTTTVTTRAPGTTQAPADFTDHGEIVKTIEVTTVPPPTTAAPAPAAPAPAAPAAPTTTAKAGGGGSPSGGGANVAPPTVSITAGTNGSNVITGTITVPPGAGATCTLIVKLHANGALLGATGVACPGPINIGNLSWYTAYDVSVSATNSGGHTDSNVVTVTVGGPPPLAAVVGDGTTKGAPPQTSWPLLAEADVAKPVTPAAGIAPGAQVNVLCQRRGPTSNGSQIYDYVQLPSSAYAWLEDAAVATTKAGDFDPRLSQTCPPGV